jgi:tetratricopeptide (TPR) repeat protein
MKRRLSAGGVVIDATHARDPDPLLAVNEPGVNALRRYLYEGQAIAFLGAGVSAPLYPLWVDVIAEMIDHAASRGLTPERAAACRALARDRPDAVVELLRRHLGEAHYRAALRETFRVRRDADTARTWTPTQELVCRCPFRAVVTTNYDPGIADARIRVRTHAISTGFTTWTDELGLDRWRSGDVYGDAELPILYAHGHHNQPDTIVLATTEYRRAYAGKLAHVLANIVTSAHLVWIGFSFADQRITTILAEVAEHAGTRISPGAEPRHVAVMAWDPANGQDPDTLRTLAEIDFGAELVLYPAPDGDHSALVRLLGSLTDVRYPAVGELPATIAPPDHPLAATVGRSRQEPLRVGSSPTPLSESALSLSVVPVEWVPGLERVSGFVGRAEELARLNRWAADPTVRLVGVSAWGGAGKTALVTHWLQNTGSSVRAGVRGVFGWSFYADPDPGHWARALLGWAAATFGVRVRASDGGATVAATVIALLQALPLIVVLDGLEVIQEGPASDAYGRLLDGSLREILTAACRFPHRSLVVLTSRFPFADLASYDGGSARMLDVPPFTPAEGAALLADTAPAAPLTDTQRRQLVGQVDGHALAVATIAGLLAEHPDATLTDLPALLATPDTTQAKVNRVLNFYAGQLAEADRYLVAAVAMFTRPATPEQLLTLARHEVFGQRLDGWTVLRVQAAVGGRLSGLITDHPDGTITAHPLVRQTFRPLALGAAQIAVDTALADTPTGALTNRTQALQVVEAIELLLDADQWQAADDLFNNRSNLGSYSVWQTLPAARLGQRAATAFVATPDRRHVCRTQLTRDRVGFYLTAVGVSALYAGDLDVARDYLLRAIQEDRETKNSGGLTVDLRSLADCLGRLGHIQPAIAAAEESLTYATATGDRHEILDVHAYRGWVADLAGDTPTAEHHFLAADHIEHTDDPEDAHLYSLPGVWWAGLLARTGRPGPARRLTTANLAICERNAWNDDAARCRVVLARLDLSNARHTAAREHLDAALRTFRDGDYLVDLADALTVAADHARQIGEHDQAADHLDEALILTTPRQLTPTQADALSIRAHLAVDRYTSTGASRHLYEGRDAADAARRLATGPHPLPWQLLAALHAHARLDQAEHTDHGFAAHITHLQHRLIPSGLDPDPLTTIEKQVKVELGPQAEADGFFRRLFENPHRYGWDD